MEQPKVFRRSRVILVALLAISVCVFSGYRTLSKVEFQKVPHGKGDYSWTDHNHNGKIDLDLEEEFPVSKNGDYEKISALEILRNIPLSLSTIGFLGLALLAMVGRDINYMWRIRTLTNKELSWKASFRTIMIWEYASALAPGVLSGAAVAMFILNRERIALGRATAIVIITAFFDNLFFVILIPIVFLFYSYNALLPESIGTSASTVFWVGYSVFFVLCFLLFTSIFLVPSFLKRLLGAVTRLPILKRWNTKALETGENVRQTALELRGEKPKFWLKVGAATVFSWTSRYLVISFIFQAFVQLNVFQHVLLLSKQFVLWMFMRVAPTPGGSGVAEWAFGELLSTFSASAVVVGSLAIVWRVIGYFPYLIIGSIILPRWLAKKAEKNT